MTEGRRGPQLYPVVTILYGQQKINLATNPVTLAFFLVFCAGALEGNLFSLTPEQISSVGTFLPQKKRSA